MLQSIGSQRVGHDWATEQQSKRSKQLERWKKCKFTPSVLCFNTELCPTLCNPIDSSLSGSSVHGEFPGKNIRVGCRALLQGIFPSQGLNSGLPHSRGFFTIWATREALTSSQFNSVTQSCPTLCDPMDCSMLGFAAHHQLPKFTQTHVHWVGDAIQASHSLSSPFPPAFKLSQHQGLFFWEGGGLTIRFIYDIIQVSMPFSQIITPSPSLTESKRLSQFFASGGQSIGASASASFLPMNIQHWFPIGLTGLISSLSKGLSRVFSNTTVKASVLQHSSFFIVQLSHPYMTTGKPILWLDTPLSAKWCLCFLIHCLGLS